MIKLGTELKSAREVPSDGPNQDSGTGRVDPLTILGKDSNTKITDRPQWTVFSSTRLQIVTPICLIECRFDLAKIKR